MENNKDKEEKKSIICIECKSELPSDSFTRRQRFKSPNSKCIQCTQKLQEVREHSKDKKSIPEEKTSFLLDFLKDDKYMDSNENIQQKLLNWTKYRLKYQMIIPCYKCKEKERFGVTLAISSNQTERNIICNHCYEELVDEAKMKIHSIKKRVIDNSIYTDAGYSKRSKDE